MAIQVITVAAPSFLASALVNGDTSGLDAADLTTLETVKEYLGYQDGWRVVDVERDDDGHAIEERFTWAYRIYGGDTQGGSVLDYVLHRVR